MDAGRGHLAAAGAASGGAGSGSRAAVGAHAAGRTPAAPGDPGRPATMGWHAAGPAAASPGAWRHRRRRRRCPSWLPRRLALRQACGQEGHRPREEQAGPAALQVQPHLFCPPRCAAVLGTPCHLAAPPCPRPAFSYLAPPHTSPYQPPTQTHIHCRQKERAKLAEVEEEADALQRQLDQLRLANQQLQLEQTLLEKLLVVRNAIASVVIQLDALPLRAEQLSADQEPQPQSRPQQAQQAQQRGDASGCAAAAAQAAGPSAAALLQDPAALQAVSQHLAAALGELPSLDQVEQMVGQVGADGSLGPAGAQARCTGVGSSGGGSGDSDGAPVDSSSSSMAAEGGGAPAAALPPISAAAEAAAASGLAIDKSRLREVAPLPCPTAQQTLEVSRFPAVPVALRLWEPCCEPCCASR